MPFFVETRSSPVVVVAQHGGRNRVPGAAVRRMVCRADIGTWLLAERCAVELGASFLAMNIHRSHVDANRDPTQDPFADGFASVYVGFHITLNNVVARTLERHGRAFVLDVHGFTESPGPGVYDAVLGTDKNGTCDESLSNRFCASLSRHWIHTVFSPDTSHEISSGFSGGYVVRSLAKTWRSRGLNAVQIELARDLRTPDERLHTAHILAESIRELFL